ncbi:ArsR/SmtB family transcription factor (plasmid) [Raoultella ornithinolytica]|uniref:ArsR/SmtB family transcription factor n=1 Tax=Raoultella ornithinolytica TaxID=54291 RepID=UPI00292B93AF|nr:metalloregulator ArsR/SmtB family transcription factor [Raoultella ornithinolytica]MDV1095015.1 metalloregulator ArsR/SmtB family transcription factor [Raoultella ornithinolytica]MDV1124011.1 metalloregulator ArsR/SmtB family transcription factor [Raoultella ornithinolytica]MDV1894295.1 metalloregulator ArsR/SmtB family transcription factor [Raoultella ornithinolytica]
MELNFAAAVLKELGHATRLEIYKALIKAGYQGMPVGELQKKLGVPASTLSHHLSSLISVSLVRQKRQGRTLYCHACYENLCALIAFLAEECCTGADGLHDTNNDVGE